jgi:hypothetical protein
VPPQLAYVCRPTARCSVRGPAGRERLAVGQIERGYACLGILGQAAAAGSGQARLRQRAARGAGVAQHRDGLAQLARQHHEATVQIDPRPDDLDRAGNAELGARRHDAVGRRQIIVGDDRDVAAMALHRLGHDPAALQDQEVRVDQDVPAIADRGMHRGGDLATEPALPAAAALASTTMPLPVPVTVKGPPETTATVPPLAQPAVAELICPPADKLNAPPAVNLT